MVLILMLAWQCDSVRQSLSDIRLLFRQIYSKEQKSDKKGNFFPVLNLDSL